MIRKYCFAIIMLLGILSTVSMAAIQPSMFFRSNWVNKSSMSLVALPDNSNNWVISFAQSTMGSGTNQWFKMEVTGNYTTNQTWGYGNAPTFNTSTNIPINGANGLITAASGKTYVFSIKDVANSTASVGYVFELGGTPASVNTVANSSPTPSTAVTVTATLSSALATNQTVWLRYAVGSATYSGSSIIPMTGSGTTYTATIPGQAVGAVVYYYCFTSGTVAGGGGVTTSNITQATINKSANSNYTVATSQVLTISPTSLSGFSYFPENGPSASQTYTLSGQYLTGYPGTIAVTAPPDFEISTNSGATWVTSASIAFASATLDPVTIAARLKAGLPQGSYSENVAHDGGGASTANLVCSGTVLKYAPAGQAASFSASNGSPSSTVIHFTWIDVTSGSPVPDGYLIRGSNTSYASIQDPQNNIAVPDGALDKNIAQGVQSADITGLNQGTTYYFKIYAYANSGNNIKYNLVSPPQSLIATTVTTYYSKSSGNLDELTSWGANADGSGNNPISFTSDGMTYIIKNNPSPVIGAAWTVTGATTKVQVGDGTNSLNFSLPYGISATNLDIMNHATMTLGANCTLTGTTSVKTGATLNCSTYVVGGTGGVFTLNSGATLKIGSPQGITNSGATGNIQTTGTRTYSTSAKYIYNGIAAQVTGNGFSQSLASGGQLQISNTGGVVSFSQYVRIYSGASCLVDEGATLATGVSNYPQFDAGSSVTINGTFQIDQGAGCVGGTNFIYGANGTFAANSTSSQIGIYNNNPFWNNNSGYVATPPNVNIKGAGGISIQTGCTLTVSGTFQTAGPVAITSPALLQLNGTCKLNAGGSFSNSPAFGSASLLVYNQGGARTRGNEWTANTSGTGFPANVQVSNLTTLAMSTTAAQCSGSVTVDSGSTLNTTSAMLVVEGNVAVSGTLSLGGDLKTKGNWTVTGSVLNNSKAVWFTGAATRQVIKNANGGVVYFDYLLIDKTNGSVVVSNNPNTDIVINSASGSVLQILNAGVLDLNGRSIALNNSGGEVLTNGASRIITSSLPGATISINGSKTIAGSPNTLIVDTNVTLSVSAPLDFGSVTTTINGTLLLNSGYSIVNSPAYGPTSLLKYYCGGVPTRGGEWNSASGYGYPNDVQVGYATTLDPGSTLMTGIPLNIARDLTIDENSSIYMDYNSHNMTVPLKVGRHVTLSGSLSLSGVIGGDLEVAGNFMKTGALYTNSRQIMLNGSNQQNLSGKFDFPYLKINNLAGARFCGTENNSVINALTFTQGKLYLDSSNLYLNGAIDGTPGSVSMIVTSGTGELRRTISSVPVSLLFPVGSDSIYSPVNLTLNSGTLTSAYIGVRVMGTKSTHNSSQLHYLNRTWNISGSGITGAVFSDSLYYAISDITGSENSLTAGVLNSSTWHPLGNVDAVAHCIKGSGITYFGEFTAGEAQAMTGTTIGVVNLTVIPEAYYSIRQRLLKINDTLTVYLAQAGTPWHFVDSANVRIDSVSFTGAAQFAGAPSGSYYLVVCGKAVLQTWSSAPIPYITGSAINYNFTTAQSKAYGSNSILVGDKYCLYSGDINQDGIIDFSDIVRVDNDAYNVLHGHTASDINGDNVVDGLDVDYVAKNAGDFISIASPKVTTSLNDHPAAVPTEQRIESK